METHNISERERVFYDKLYRHIKNSRKNLSLPRKEPVESPNWGYEVSAEIDTLARQNGYRLFRHYNWSWEKDSTLPEVHVVGYEQTSMDKTISFLEALALSGIFEECALLSEGYDGEAALLSRVRPVTNSRLNTLFSKYRIKLTGEDNFVLRERQYAALDDLEEIATLKTSKSEEEIRAKVHIAMKCLVKREKNYFLPAILKQKQQGKPIIFLANMVHAVSFALPQMLNNTGVKYAFFVPVYSSL